MEIRSTSRSESSFGAIQQLDPDAVLNRQAERPEDDTVNVSRDALLLTEALRSAQTAPDVRAEKVAELRSRIDAGTYKVDSRRIAAALLKDECQLFCL